MQKSVWMIQASFFREKIWKANKRRFICTGKSVIHRDNWSVTNAPRGSVLFAHTLVNSSLVLLAYTPLTWISYFIPERWTFFLMLTLEYLFRSYFRMKIRPNGFCYQSNVTSVKYVTMEIMNAILQKWKI